MVDKVEFSLIGVDSVIGKLDSVAQDVKRRGGRSSLRRAAELIATRLRENALALDDASSGRSIADNVGLRWNGRLFKRAGDLGFRVGILRGAVLPKAGSAVDKNAGAPTPHWRLLEFGTEKMPAIPFARRALSDNIGEAIDTFVGQYDKSLDRAIKRAKKKGLNT